MYWRLGVVALLTVWSAAGQEYPPTKPLLRIETGMHTAGIWRMDTDAAGRFLVTASYDKTARVWDAGTGKLLQVLRPPQGEGDEGKLYAVAISPDGATVAVGGLSRSIYLFDRASGRLTRHIDGIRASVFHLSYSRDGGYLAAAQGQSAGVRLFRTSDLKEIASEIKCSSDSYWADFDAFGRLLTTCFDGFVRLYDPIFHLIREEQAPGGKKPYEARFSPDGTKIAVGFNDTSNVNVLSSPDLKLLSTFVASNGNLGGIAWSSEGQTLFAAGTSLLPSGDSPIFSWTTAGKGIPDVRAAAENTVTSLRWLGNGLLAFASAEPRIGVIGSNPNQEWHRSPNILDRRMSTTALSVSRDGSTIEFGFVTSVNLGVWTRRVARFDVLQRQLALDTTGMISLKAPDTTTIAVTNWRNFDKPVLNGAPLPLQESEGACSLAIAADGKTFLIGTQFFIRKFDNHGKQDWVVLAPSAAWQVNLTPDGQYAVAAFGDGTIRWYTADKGQEVLALFIHKDQRWVAWTPEGFFAASPGAESLIGYHLNHGNDHEGEFIKVDQLKDLFYRPDLISKALTPAGRTEIAEVRAKVDVERVLASGSPPDIDLLSPATSQSDGEFDLKFRIQNKGGGIGRIVYEIDGAPIEGRAVGIPGLGPNTYSAKIPLPPGHHLLTAKAFNGRNEVESRAITAAVDVKAPTGRSDLYVLAAGVSAYRHHTLQQGVRFAAADAEEIARRLKQQGAGLFGNVVATALTDANATLAKIQSTIADMAKHVQPKDVFVLYLAGHGMALDGNYHFLPWEVRYTSTDALKEQSLNQEMLQDLLKKITANKVLLLLDTCSSGSAIGRDPLMATDKGAIDRLSKLTGRATLAATAADQMALEGYKNHGVFTYAILEGLEKAFDAQGYIQITALADYVEKRVPEITLERWHYEEFPMKELKGQTFPIARKP